MASRKGRSRTRSPRELAPDLAPRLGLEPVLLVPASDVCRRVHLDFLGDGRAEDNLAGAFFSDTSPLGNYTVTARDAGGNVLETLVILSGQLPPASTCTVDGCGIWVGFDRPQADISSITFGPSSSFGDAFAIDDLRFNADVIPITADDCKKGGWKLFHIDGATFKNQGDCVSFVATGGKNQPAGG